MTTVRYAHYLIVRLALAMCCLSVPSLARAQTATQPALAACSIQVFTERQVQQPVRFLSEPPFSPHPVAAARDSSNVVQFVVDTTGVPELPTFKAVRVADSTLVADARALAQWWRYAPAVASGCKVRQLVQTAVGR